MAIWRVLLPFMQGDDWMLPGETVDLAPAQSVFLALGNFVEPFEVEEEDPPGPPPVDDEAEVPPAVPNAAPKRSSKPVPVRESELDTQPTTPKEEKKP